MYNIFFIFRLFIVLYFSVNLFRVFLGLLRGKNFFDIKISKFLDFLRWKFVDIKNYNCNEFKEFGLTLFSGPQGSGKTVSMVDYLERIRKKYPNCIIVTNFGYCHQDYEMNSWDDFFKYRNGTSGVVFAIDELQNEYSSSAWKDFPEQLLSEITQQRKQRIKIIASSQVYTRVVKQLREQCFEVVECCTLLSRWTFNKCFNAEDYNFVIDSLDKKNKLRRKWRRNFVQTDKLRALYDSYEKVERMKKMQFLPREFR